MKIEQLIEQIAARVSERVLQEVVNLPQMQWIQWQVDSWNYNAWHQRMTDRAREVAEIVHNHFGLELTPEQIVVSVNNDCGERPALDFLHSLLHDPRHLRRWADSFLNV